MLKLAGRILDQYDDPAFVSSPDVTAVGLMSSDAVAALPDRDFAMVAKLASGKHRRFPVPNKKMAAVSAAYFAENGGQLPPEWRTKVAARLREVLGSITEPVVDDTAHGVSISIDDAKKLAADEFLRNFDRMTPGERVCAASDLHAAGIADDSRILDYVPSPVFGPMLKQGMRDRRAALVGDTTKLAALANLESRFAAIGPIRAACALDEFDRATKIAKRVPDAFRTVWGGTVKPLAPKSDLEEQYRIDTLAKEHAEHVKGVFAEPIASAFLRDPRGYFKNATGQIKSVLRTLVSAVANRKPMPEIRNDQRPTAVGDHSPARYAADCIRHDTGAYVPWSHQH